MNDRWTDAAPGIAEGASAELASALAGLAVLPVHSPARAALAVLDAYAVPAGAEVVAA